MGQEEINTLLQAAKSNDMNYLAKALDDGADINGTDSESNTAVIFATQNSNVEALEELISRGADVKANNCNRLTALHVLYPHGERAAEIAQMLIDAGADLEAEDCSHFTPLMVAARERAPAAVIEVLLEAGADKSHESCNRENAHKIGTDAGCGSDVLEMLAV